MTELYGYQKIGVRKIEKFGGRCVVGDDLGLGKTIQALSWRHNYLDDNAVTIVICEKTVKINWQREASMHFGARAVILDTLTPPRRIPKSKLYVVSYGILAPRRSKHRRLRGWAQALKKLRPKLVIIDEVQNLANPASKQTKATKFLCKGVKHVIGLGGSAGMNKRPIELWPTLNIIDPKRFKSRHSFGKKFCGARKNFGRWEYKGATRLKQLNRLLTRRYMIRRRKQDVLKDLPPITRTVIAYEPTPRQMAEYKKCAESTSKWLHRFGADRNRVSERLQKLNELKRMAGLMKVEFAKEWVENFLKNEDGKVIVFAIHKKVIKPLAEHFGRRCTLIDGGVTGAKRQKAIDEFNHDRRCRVLFGNVRAAGVGWNCKSASVELAIEFDWTAGRHMQAEGRIHGVGRGLPGCHAQIYYACAIGTIEESLCRMIQETMENMGQILDGRDDLKELNILDKLTESLMRMNR